MAVDPVFSEAFIHRLARPYREADPWSAQFVAGRRLRPFSLWHLLLLQQIESPLLSHPGAAGRLDLLRATAICRCRMWEVSVEARWSPRAIWKLAGARFQAERARFLDYLDDFLQRPDWSIASNRFGGAKGPSLPLGQPPEVGAVAGDVITATHWPERKVWEMPIGAAYWYQALARRQRDPVDFMTPEERQFQAEMKAEVARTKAKDSKEAGDAQGA